MKQMKREDRRRKESIYAQMIRDHSLKACEAFHSKPYGTSKKFRRVYDVITENPKALIQFLLQDGSTDVCKGFNDPLMAMQFLKSKVEDGPDVWGQIACIRNQIGRCTAAEEEACGHDRI